MKLKWIEIWLKWFFGFTLHYISSYLMNVLKIINYFAILGFTALDEWSMCSFLNVILNSTSIEAHRKIKFRKTFYFICRPPLERNWSFFRGFVLHSQIVECVDCRFTPPSHSCLLAASLCCRNTMQNREENFRRICKAFFNVNFVLINSFFPHLIIAELFSDNE